MAPAVLTLETVLESAVLRKNQFAVGASKLVAAAKAVGCGVVSTLGPCEQIHVSRSMYPARRGLAKTGQCSVLSVVAAMPYCKSCKRVSVVVSACFFKR